MQICCQDDALEVRDIDPFLAELLRQIPESTATNESSAADARLFSPPTAGHENEFCAEWKAYVEPGLRKLFQSATETVRHDLEQLTCGTRPGVNSRLRIPLAHADAWLSALNQARLAVAANYQFTESDLSDHYRSPFGSRRDLGLFQVNFYGFLQELILREIQSPDQSK